jgi:hypothetical protein
MFFDVGVGNVHNHYTDGVYRLNETACLVVLNKVGLYELNSVDP